MVDKPYDAAVVESESRRVNILAVRVVAYAKYLGLVGIIDVEGEVIARHHPVELGRDHARERYLGRGDLALQLVLRPAFPCIHEGRKVVFE